MAHKLLKFRSLCPETLQEDRRHVPSVSNLFNIVKPRWKTSLSLFLQWVIDKFFNNLEVPKLEEGFDGVETLPFVIEFDESSSPLSRRLLQSFLWERCQRYSYLCKCQLVRYTLKICYDCFERLSRSSFRNFSTSSIENVSDFGYWTNLNRRTTS